MELKLWPKKMSDCSYFIAPLYTSNEKFHCVREWTCNIGILNTLRHWSRPHTLYAKCVSQLFSSAETKRMNCDERKMLRSFEQQMISCLILVPLKIRQNNVGMILAINVLWFYQLFDGGRWFHRWKGQLYHKSQQWCHVRTFVLRSIKTSERKNLVKSVLTTFLSF